MKVYKSNYRYHWINPYAIIKKAVFWREVDVVTEDWVTPVANFLTPISKSIQWVLDRIHPQINYVKIDPWDTWSMFNTLAAITLPMLKQLKATKHGYPGDMTEKEWDKTIDKMIWSFEMIHKDETFYGFEFKDKITKREITRYKKHMAKVQEGFDLFGKHFMNLWD